MKTSGSLAPMMMAATDQGLMLFSPASLSDTGAKDTRPPFVLFHALSKSDYLRTMPVVVELNAVFLIFLPATSFLTLWFMVGIPSMAIVPGGNDDISLPLANREMQP